MSEKAITFGRDGSLVGILTDSVCEKAQAKNGGQGLLLLGAGFIHRVGPNRLYVKIARYVARMGLVSLRFDFSGIGDSGPRRDKMPLHDSVVEEAQQAMNYLEAVRGIEKFAVVGLCTGAAAAAQVALADHRVKKAVLINPMAPESDQTEQMKKFTYYHQQALLSPRSWLKFILMRSDYKEIWKMVKFNIKTRFYRDSFKSRETKEFDSELKSFFQKMIERKVELLIISSDNEIGISYFKKAAGTEYRKLKRSNQLSTIFLKGADHPVTPLCFQEELIRFISNWFSKKNENF